MSHWAASAFLFWSNPDQPPLHQSCDHLFNAVVTNNHLSPTQRTAARVNQLTGCLAAPLISQSSNSSIPAAPQVLPFSRALLSLLLPYQHFPLLGYLLKAALPPPPASTCSSTQILSLQLYEHCSRMLFIPADMLQSAWVAEMGSWSQLASGWAQVSPLDSLSMTDVSHSAKGEQISALGTIYSRNAHEFPWHYERPCGHLSSSSFLMFRENCGGVSNTMTLSGHLTFGKCQLGCLLLNQVAEKLNHKLQLCLMYLKECRLVTSTVPCFCILMPHTCALCFKKIFLSSVKMLLIFLLVFFQITPFFFPRGLFRYKYNKHQDLGSCRCLTYNSILEGGSDLKWTPKRSKPQEGDGQPCLCHTFLKEKFITLEELFPL